SPFAARTSTRRRPTKPAAPVTRIAPIRLSDILPPRPGNAVASEPARRQVLSRVRGRLPGAGAVQRSGGGRGHLLAGDLLHDVDRPWFHFIEDAPDILSEDAQADELDTAHEQGDHHDRGPAIDGDSHQNL